MNHELPPFADPAREREWQAQERALHAERMGRDPCADDARTRRYRLLARALREPLPDALPADFAEQMESRVTAAPIRGTAADARHAWGVIVGLVAALTVLAGAMLVFYDDTWWPAFRGLLPAHGVPGKGWILALGGCLGASWLLELWQDHRGLAGQRGGA